MERIVGAPQHDLPFGDEGPLTAFYESYVADSRAAVLLREIRLRNGASVTSEIRSEPHRPEWDLHDAYDAAWLRSTLRPLHAADRGTVRLADLFCGCGALSLGIAEACRALRLGVEHVFAADIDPTALKVYGQNFPGGRYCGDPVESLVGHVNAPLSAAERTLRKDLGQIDILAGGPPCQGHSDLNNYTRRQDPKNALFSALVRFAQVLEPTHIIVENVPGIRHDKGSVVEGGRRVLESMGYKVTESVLTASDLGVPQRRRRYLMVASTAGGFDFRNMSKVIRGRTLRWACGDLVDGKPTTMLDSHATSSRDNRKRIQYLFDHGLYDLPDEFRPPCHSKKPHTYKAVYGRLRWDEPAPTITSGFNSPGQGRFIHPSLPRPLTPHEAARVQFLPDFFAWGTAKREALTQMIGNAVPPKLAYLVALELLR